MTLTLIIITCIISFYGFSNPAFFEKYKFNPYKINRNGEHIRWISHGFLHADISHLMFNMFTFYFAGQQAAYIFSPDFVFIAFYLLAIAVSSIPDYIQNKNNPYYASIGASGAVSSALFSMMLFSPWGLIYVYFIPIYFIIFALLYLGYSFYMSKRSNDNIGHMAHLTGALFGIIATIVYRPDALTTFFREIISPPFL